MHYPLLQYSDGTLATCKKLAKQVRCAEAWRHMTAMLITACSVARQCLDIARALSHALQLCSLSVAGLPAQTWDSWSTCLHCSSLPTRTCLLATTPRAMHAVRSPGAAQPWPHNRAASGWKAPAADTHPAGGCMLHDLGLGWEVWGSEPCISRGLQLQ